MRQTATEWSVCCREPNGLPDRTRPEPAKSIARRATRRDAHLFVFRSASPSRRLFALSVENANDRSPQLGPDFAGIDAGAVWEDLKIGVEHLRRWERVAVVTDVEWIKRSVQMFGFLMPGRVKVFPSTAGAEARTWITST